MKITIQLVINYHKEQQYFFFDYHHPHVHNKIRVIKNETYTHCQPHAHVTKKKLIPNYL